MLHHVTKCVSFKGRPRPTPHSAFFLYQEVTTWRSHLITSDKSKTTIFIYLREKKSIPQKYRTFSKSSISANPLVSHMSSPSNFMVLCVRNISRHKYLFSQCQIWLQLQLEIFPMDWTLVCHLRRDIAEVPTRLPVLQLRRLNPFFLVSGFKRHEVTMRDNRSKVVTTFNMNNIWGL